MNLKEQLDDRIILEEGGKEGEFRKAAIKKVIAKIFSGGSALKTPFQAGTITISDIVKAIRNKRCLRTPEQDFGATYLEQIIGTAIRDVIPIDAINAVRSLFGLDKLPPSELVKKQEQRKPTT